MNVSGYRPLVTRRIGQAPSSTVLPQQQLLDALPHAAAEEPPPEHGYENYSAYEHDSLWRRTRVWLGWHGLRSAGSLKPPAPFGFRPRPRPAPGQPAASALQLAALQLAIWYRHELAPDQAQGGLQPRPASASLGQPRPASASLGQLVDLFCPAGHDGLSLDAGTKRCCCPSLSATVTLPLTRQDEVLLRDHSERAGDDPPYPAMSKASPRARVRVKVGVRAWVRVRVSVRVRLRVRARARARFRVRVRATARARVRARVRLRCRPRHSLSLVKLAALPAESRRNLGGSRRNIGRISEESLRSRALCYLTGTQPKPRCLRPSFSLTVPLPLPLPRYPTEAALPLSAGASWRAFHAMLP